MILAHSFIDNDMIVFLWEFLLYTVSTRINADEC
jgi:hypothetical protein